MSHPSPRRRAFAALTLTALLTGIAPTQEASEAGAPDAPKQGQLALRGLDPVLLTRGQETDGRDDLTATAGQYRYRFATAQNLATFRGDVARYEIQFGGGCGRMGPLSGTGDPDRFAVHAERIYIFASDACRESFVKRAELFLDPDTAAPQPTAEEAQRGRELLQRAIRAHGGRDRLQQLTTYRHRRTTTKGEVTREWRMFVHFPDRIRLEQDYAQADRTWRWAKVVTPEAAVFVDDGEARPMHAAAQRELQRSLLREPLFALRAALARDVVVRAAGKARVEDAAVELLELWIDGCTTTFGIGDDGLIRTAQFRGRGPQLWFMPLTQVFGDYVERDGVRLPTTVTSIADGKPTGPPEQRLDLELGGALPAGLFDR